MGEDALTASNGLAFVAGAAATLAMVLALYLIALLRRARVGADHVRSAPVAGAAKAWPDPEKGEGDAKVLGSKGGSKEFSTLELCDTTTLRSLLGDVIPKEISKGLEASELLQRLQKLEQKLAQPLAHDSLRDTALAASGEVLLKDPPKAASVETRTPNSSDISGGSSPRPEDLPGAVTIAAPPPRPPWTEKVVPPVPMPPAAPPERLQHPSPPKEFGPTERQRSLLDPPEKCAMDVCEETAELTSLATLQRILSKRDAQTTELHRQLKEARQCLWLQTSEARAANARLHALLTDPSKAPQAQAEALQRLQQEVRGLSGLVAETRAKEQHWSAIAKRQRAFFMQSERLSQEGVGLLRRHPAGDIFLAPPPVVLEDDEPFDQRAWDVGTSHCNPYSVDSWPFEPNVLAQRASQEPGLQRWNECEEEEDDDDDEEEDPDDCDGEDWEDRQAELGWPHGHVEGKHQPPAGSHTGSETSRSL